MNVEEVIKRICILEARIGVNDEAAAAEAINQVQAASEFSSHMYVIALVGTREPG